MLHGVLYPKVHLNRFKKKQNWLAVDEVWVMSDVACGAAISEGWRRTINGTSDGDGNRVGTQEVSKVVAGI